MAVASCSSVIGTSTGGCTWSGAPAAPGRRPSLAVVPLWPSWCCRPAPTTSAARAAEPARLGAAHRCSGGRRAPVDGVSGCCCAMGWSPRPANGRHSPIRLLGENATGCWCATRLPGAPSAPRHDRAQPPLVDAGSTCAGPCRVFRLLADWDVDGGSALPDLRLTPNALAIGVPVAPKAPVRQRRGMPLSSPSSWPASEPSSLPSSLFDATTHVPRDRAPASRLCQSTPSLASADL